MGLADHLRKKLGSMPATTWKRRPEVLLCPNIPKPMHGVAPRVILGDKWWDETRKAAYKSTDYHCVACGIAKERARSRQWLEGHELYDINYELGRMRYMETVPLCHFCHNYIHDGRLLMLLQSRQIHQAKYVAIIQHGDQVLREAGLRKLSVGEREALLTNSGIAPWEKWRLVLNGKLYPPKFKSYAQWLMANRG